MIIRRLTWWAVAGAGVGIAALPVVLLPFTIDVDPATITWQSVMPVLIQWGAIGAAVGLGVGGIVHLVDLLYRFLGW